MCQSDKWSLIYGREKAKEVVASKTALFFVLQQYQNKVSFQRKDSGIVLKFSPRFLNDRKCSRVENTATPLKYLPKSLIRRKNHFFGNLLDFDIAGEHKKCCF